MSRPIERALSMCIAPGCNRITRSVYCKEHKGSYRYRSHFRKMYNRKWARASRAFLSDHPLCVACQKQGKTIAAECVDHIVPHRGDQVLFWLPSNWQALCWSCHSRKTVEEKRGAGNV